MSLPAYPSFKEMQENLLCAINAHANSGWPVGWLVLSLDSVGGMLDDDMLGNLAGEIMLKLHHESTMLGGNIALLIKVFELNKRVNNRHLACALLIKILDGHDELKDMYKANLQKFLREVLFRLRSPAHSPPTKIPEMVRLMLRVVDVLAAGNEPIICVNMNTVLIAALDYKIDVTRIFGIVQEYVSTITRS